MRAAKTQKFVFMIDHFLPRLAGQRVVFLKKNGFLRTDFLTITAKDATEHVDLEVGRLFFHVAGLFIDGGAGRLNANCSRRANKFTELAGNALCAAVLVGDKVGSASITFRDNPFLFGILHCHFAPEKVAQSDSKTAKKGGKIRPFPPTEFFSFYNHVTSLCYKSAGYLVIQSQDAVMTMLISANGRNRRQPKSIN